MVEDFRLIYHPGLVKILTNVVPQLELVETWTEDELTTVLHEAVDDAGVSQKTFMTVLRHALSGTKVWLTVLEKRLKLIVRKDWTRGGGNHGYSWESAEHSSPAESRNRVLSKTSRTDLKGGRVYNT